MFTSHSDSNNWLANNWLVTWLAQILPQWKWLVTWLASMNVLDLNWLAKHDWFDLKPSCFQQVITFIRQYVYYLGFYMNLASDLEYEGQCLDRKSANENWRHQFSIWKRQKLDIAGTRVQVLPLINFERLELDLKNKSINCDLTWIIFWWLVTWLYCLPCILLVICDLTWKKISDLWLDFFWKLLTLYTSANKALLTTPTLLSGYTIFKEYECLAFIVS